jgi:hypothetical protein
MRTMRSGKPQQVLVQERHEAQQETRGSDAPRWQRLPVCEVRVRAS